MIDKRNLIDRYEAKCRMLGSIPLELELVDDKIVITGYDGTNKILIIPDIVDIIGAKSLQSKNMEKVVIGKGVKGIESEAFSSCRKLKEIDIPETVEYIGKSAFEFCTRLERVKYSLDVLPENIFSECYSLTDIEFTKDIKSIGTCALEDTAISEFKSNDLQYIWPLAFMNCKYLKEIRIAGDSIEIPTNIVSKDTGNLKVYANYKEIKTKEILSLYEVEPVGTIYIPKDCRHNIDKRLFNIEYL